MFILIPSRYAAQSSTASDDDLLHITHAGSVIEQTADRLETQSYNSLPHFELGTKERNLSSIVK